MNNAIDYEADNQADNISTPQRPMARATMQDYPLSPIFHCSPSKDARPLASSVGDVVQDFVAHFKTTMSNRLRTQLLSHLLKVTIVESEGLEFFKFVNRDFLSTSLSAMKTLFTNGKQNLIYHFSKCFEGSSPRMPVNQMPFGLLDYNIRFFAKGSTQNLGIEEHYASWLETMFSHFGHKWLCLHRGPAWQYDVELEIEAEDSLLGPVDGASTEDSVEDLDIIQCALQQSSLCFNDLDWSSDTLDDIINPESSLSENAASSSEEVIHVPHLWTHVCESQQQEMELGLVSSKEMEKIHGIQPTAHSTRRNPVMYDPLKVGFIHVLYC